MTEAQRDDALQAGRQIAADCAADVLCFGEMGIGNTSAATLIAHKLLGLPVADLVGRGTGLDDTGLAHKTAVLEAAVGPYSTGASLTAAQVLAEYGGFEIAMMAGRHARRGAAIETAGPGGRVHFDSSSPRRRSASSRPRRAT